ncbi:MAG: hypothetical protein E7812_07745 [Phenylobacterium sp.]|nr:MAG: hypothetical protein E7812_07745 [Phenylobacterium sp.]
MIRKSCLFGLCLALGALPATAQQKAIPGPYNLFVSPCGEPFRAPASEPYPVGAWFAKADANHDGSIDREEFRNDAKAFFAVLDVDGDGVIAGPEITRYERGIVPEIVGSTHGAALDRSAPGEARLWLAQIPDNVPVVQGDSSHLPAEPSQKVDPRSMEGAAAFTLLAEPEPVTSADQNFDGRITLKEFLAAADSRFKRLDRRGDGKLTLDELPHTVQQQAAETTRRKRG